jgi:hypothetical protein
MCRAMLPHNNCRTNIPHCRTRRFNEFLQLQSYVIYGFDPKKVTPADASSAELDARRSLAHLVAMDQIGAAVDKEYGTVLAEK